MKFTYRLLIALITSLCFYNCSSNDTKSKVVAEIGQPELNDNGKTIDSLKEVYNCEGIHYDNWGHKKATDSCLTVCLINSNSVPSASNVDSNVNELKGIASSIKKSLAKPQNYKSYYIIFVKKDNVNGMETKTHSAGMEINSTEL
jgi:hypothetical protein